MSLLFAVLGGVAIQRVTQPARVRLALLDNESNHHEQKRKGWITLKSAHLVESLSLTIDEKPLKLIALSEQEYEAELEWDSHSALHVFLQWSDQSHESALQVTLETESGVAVSHTFWESGELSEELQPSRFLARFHD